jgi:hypothetical protein
MNAAQVNWSVMRLVQIALVAAVIVGSASTVASLLVPRRARSAAVGAGTAAAGALAMVGGDRRDGRADVVG